MTVKELREMLAEVNDDSPIQILDPEGNVYEIKDEIKMFRGTFMIEAMPQEEDE